LILVGSPLEANGFRKSLSAWILPEAAAQIAGFPLSSLVVRKYYGTARSWGES